MDLDRIDPSIPGELERWAAQWAVTPEALAAAVRVIGTDVDKLQGYLAAHPHAAPPPTPAGG